MSFNRRTFLAASAALCAAPFVGRAAELLPRPKGRRVVIVGGGWGGLSAARHLRDLAPDLEVVVLEKNPAFWSCPLSNKWLVGLMDTKFLVHPVLAWSQAPGINRSMNYAEVASVIETPLRRLAGRDRRPRLDGRFDVGPVVDLSRLGRTTAAVVDLLLAMLHRAGVDLEVEMAKATVTRVGRDPVIGLLGGRRGHG